MLSFYILMLVLGVNQWLAVLGAIAFGFTTNNFTLYEAGHITKLRAISYFPLVAAGMLVTYRKHFLWGGILFAAGLGLNILANHIQMSYYLALTIPFFAIAELIRDIRRGQIIHFLKASGILIVAAGLAAGFSKIGGRFVSVVFAYPFAMTAIFLPPVVAGLLTPSISNLVLDPSYDLAVWILDTFLSVGGINETLRGAFDLETFGEQWGVAGLGYVLMWLGISVPLGWFLGVLVALANLIRPKPDA